MAHKNKVNLITKLFFYILLGLTIFNVLITVYSVKDQYLRFDFSQRYEGLKKVYLESQYVQKHPKGWIPDQTVNTYAGVEYINGLSPVLIASDTPPFGRYLIGLSVLLFNNENIVTLIFSFTSLLLMFLLGRQIFTSRLFAILPSFLFSFEPIFKNQIVYTPLLDIFQLVFLLSCFYYFNKGNSSKKTFLYFLLANVFLGFFISTKFFITGLTIVAAWYFVLLIRRQKDKLKALTITLPISVFILLLNYIRVFAYGYTINKFLGIQKYVFVYHKSQLILPLSIWPLLLFNKWFVWYGNKPIIFDSQWSFTWPLITVFSLLSILLYIFKKIPRKQELEVTMVWFVLYMLFFSFGQISSRYFVILIPVLYIISIYGIFYLTKPYLRNFYENSY